MLFIFSLTVIIKVYHFTLLNLYKRKQALLGSNLSGIVQLTLKNGDSMGFD